MRRRWKILLWAIGVLAVLLTLNTIVLDQETKSARLTVPGAQLLSVQGAQLQVKQDGPRGAPPIVILHCFACSINWWNEITPILAKDHRVIRIDLLGHGGSEKPSGGYSMENQARLVALVLGQLGVRRATVVGHSMGGNVAVALAQQTPGLVNRLVLVDRAPSTDLGHVDFTTRLSVVPVIGEAMKRTAPDFMIRDGLGQAFAPGFDVPDRFVDDLKRMTYTAYRNSAHANEDYRDAVPLDDRVARTGLPLLVIFGSEDQIEDVEKSLARFKQVPGALTKEIAGSGHSPQVEKPRQTARLISRFAIRGELDEARGRFKEAVHCLDRAKTPSERRRCKDKYGFKRGRNRLLRR